MLVSTPRCTDVFEMSTSYSPRARQTQVTRFRSAFPCVVRAAFLDCQFTAVSPRHPGNPRRQERVSRTMSLARPGRLPQVTDSLSCRRSANSTVRTKREQYRCAEVLAGVCVFVYYSDDRHVTRMLFGDARHSGCMAFSPRLSVKFYDKSVRNHLLTCVQHSDQSLCRHARPGLFLRGRERASSLEALNR